MISIYKFENYYIKHSWVISFLLSAIVLLRCMTLLSFFFVGMNMISFETNNVILCNIRGVKYCFFFLK